MLQGYARVSSTEQETRLQRDALEAVGVSRLWEEKRSACGRRPVLVRLLYSVRRGDVVVVYKLDRLARSLTHLLALLSRLDALGVGLRSLTEPVDTTTPAGRMLVQLLGAFAEFERALIRERSMAGQDAAKARGVQFGRPRAMTALQEQDAVSRVLAGDSMASVARVYGCHLSSVKRAVLRVRKPDSPAVRSVWRDCERSRRGG